VDAAHIPLRHALAFPSSNGHPILMNRFTHWANRWKRPDNPSEHLFLSTALPLPFLAQAMEALASARGDLYVSTDPERWVGQLGELAADLKSASPLRADEVEVFTDDALFTVPSALLHRLLPCDAFQGGDDYVEFTLCAGSETYDARAFLVGKCERYRVQGDWGFNKHFLEALGLPAADANTPTTVRIHKKYGRTAGSGPTLVVRLPQGSRTNAQYEAKLAKVRSFLEEVAQDIVCDAVSLSEAQRIIKFAVDNVQHVDILKILLKKLFIVPASINATGSPTKNLMLWLLREFGYGFYCTASDLLFFGDIEICDNVYQCPYHNIDSFFSNKLDTLPLEREFSYDLIIYLPLTFMAYFSSKRETINPRLMRKAIEFPFQHKEDHEDCSCNECYFRDHFQSTLLANLMALRQFFVILYHVLTNTDATVPPLSLLSFARDHHMRAVQSQLEASFHGAVPELSEDAWKKILFHK